MAVPLLALRSGYSGIEVGVLVAISAATQTASRMVLGAVMRIVGDWVLIVGAAAMLAASNALVVASAAAVPFAAAMAVQGVARACFWTGSQTHVVRRPGSSVGALATVNFTSSVGLLVGPLAAGLIGENSLRLALLAGALVALVAVLPALALDRLPPFSPPSDRPAGRIWRRPGVSAGCWAGASAGAWRGLIGSYVPVALEAARQPASTTGALVSVANAAATIGALLAGRVSGAWVARSLSVGALAAGLAMCVLVPVADLAVVAAIVLAVSGLGAGALQTVGPAVATDAVHAEERGEAIAAAGAFRAAALFGSPLVVALAITTLPLAVAMAGVGALIAAPGLRRMRELSLHPSATLSAEPE